MMLFNRGVELSDEGRYEEAIECYTKAIDSDSSFLFVEVIYNNRGLCYRELGKYEEAIKDFTEATSYLAFSGFAYYNRAECYDILNQHKKAHEDYINAIKAYTEVIEKLPNHSDSYLGRAQCYMKLQQFKEAFDDCKKAIACTEDEDKIRQAQEYMNKVENELKKCSTKEVNSSNINPYQIHCMPKHGRRVDF